MKVTGTLTDKKVDYTKSISVAQGVTKTFIQTDKPLYKPGQEVQFRILTVVGPFLRISKKNYNVWVETPSGSRIAQWTNVDNSAGLIHLAFKLADQLEEGQYTIKIRLSEGGSTTSHTFKVEEYVLPRIEVNLIPPKYILGSDKNFTFTVCANYTFGQPVTGIVTLSFEGCSWNGCHDYYNVTKKISGCKKINILSEDVQLNRKGSPLKKMVVNATVVEEGTDETFRANVTVTVNRSTVHFRDVGKEMYIKPNLPYTKKIKATLPDGSPLPNALIGVCNGGGICRDMMTGPDGILEIVAPSNSTGYTIIQAESYPFIRSGRDVIMSEGIHMYRSSRYYSPSNSSLLIHAPEGRLPCSSGGHNRTLTVLFAAVNQTKALVSVQVISRGQIQFSSAEEYEFSASSLPIKEEHLLEPIPPAPEDTIIGVLNIPIKLPRSVSPTAKVLVWYVRPDGEVVSDVLFINIEKCSENDVSLQWSSDRVLQGEQAMLTLSTSPNSLCSLAVVDKRSELLSSQTDEINLEKVFDTVENSMIGRWDNIQYIWEYCENWGEGNQSGPEAGNRVEYSGHRGPSDADALLMIDTSGLHILTDLTVRLCDGFVSPSTPPPPTASTSSGPESRRREKRSRPDRSSYIDALQKFDRAGMYVMRDLIAKAYIHRYGTKESVPVSNADEQRTYDPETWLWKIKMADASGVLSEQYTLPDTMAEWVGKAVCLSSETGLGFSEKAAITTFTPFFVDFTLPPSIKRGEILSVKISVFNYLDHALPVKVILKESSEYEILEESDSELPVGHGRACIPEQQKVVHTVKIRTLVLGEVNITIDAFVDERYPDICGPEYLVFKRDVLVKPIKVEAKGFPREKTWTNYICSKDVIADVFEKWKIEVPSAIVEDSARGWVTAVGDLLGPTLENLGSLVEMPHGTGEQNMMNFAPNIFFLQYLEASNQTTPDIERKAIENMEQGYQRELRYRHEDGSFSAFRSSDATGSTWLTAFVLKSLAQARQYIQVDENDLKKAQNWLERKQLENGCFQSVGNVFNKDMKGGSDGSRSPVPLTSYVLIALLESGGFPASTAVMEDAAFCLRLHASTDPYTLALKAYALALSGASEANRALQKLLTLATESSNFLYWEMPAGLRDSEAVAVETAGYAILAMMTLDANLYKVQASKIVRWISSQRNGQGGFISTQDTVVALQALASFEAHQEKEPLHLTVSVQAEGVEHTFSIDESNKLLQQQVNLPSIPTNVTVDMEGQGCSLVQAVLRYNVPESSEVFALSVTAETVQDKKCIITQRIKACASYLLPGQKSNMAIMEFNLVSGYIPHRDDLKGIIGNGTGRLKRYEVDGSKVYFYVDEFSPEETCVQFRILRQVDVEDAKPGSVMVYEYSQTEFSVGKTYVLPPPDDCQVPSIYELPSDFI